MTTKMNPVGYATAIASRRMCSGSGNAYAANAVARKENPMTSPAAIADQRSDDEARSASLSADPNRLSWISEAENRVPAFGRSTA
jgi:hypothetical protein